MYDTYLLTYFACNPWKFDRRNVGWQHSHIRRESWKLLIKYSSPRHRTFIDRRWPFPLTTFAVYEFDAAYKRQVTVGVQRLMKTVLKILCSRLVSATCTYVSVHSRTHWRRSVVNNSGQGQSGQAIKLFQAPRKISFTFHFDKSLSPFIVWNLQSFE